MRNLLVHIGSSKILRVVAAVAALISGLDDLVELYFGIEDFAGLDAAHGVVFMALSGILDPLAKLVGETKEPLIEMAKKE